MIIYPPPPFKLLVFDSYPLRGVVVKKERGGKNEETGSIYINASYLLDHVNVNGARIKKLKFKFYVYQYLLLIF